MTTDTGESKPMLASLVQAGEQQTEVVSITGFVHMVRDISNAYLVNTADGDVMVNTGFMTSTERNKGLFASVRSGALQAIVLTQAHPDHYGGVPTFLEPGTKVIAERRFTSTCAFFDLLDPYIRRRSGKLWSGTIKNRDALVIPKVVPDIAVDGLYSFTAGERQFEVISTPGGEAPDSVVVWMPAERIVFTGNLFGPVFMSMPNLCTLRGDKPRSAQRFLESLDTVRKLGAELLITGHGEPIHGAEHIRAELDKLHAAVSYVHQATVDGMNAGVDVHTLMREVKLPEPLSLGEFHGKVSWAVRTIWEEYSGWFHFDSTTSLYGVPRTSIDTDLVELAGGAGPLAARARKKLDAGSTLEAVHLLDVALGAEPHNSDALSVKKDALTVLLSESGGANLSEVMWLKSEIAAVEAAIGAAQ
ncbi:MAG: MBL fold metallo-hydrolase [Halioglobus sp.]|nr:MBL fold metallo-hydrolase [Halioglobus sp.]